MANGKQDPHDTLEAWNGLFTRHGLTARLEKTTVLHICHQGEGLYIEQDGKKLTEGDSLVEVQCTGQPREIEVRRRTRAGVQCSLAEMAERLVRSRFQWAGHEKRMADVRLPE